MHRRCPPAFIAQIPYLLLDNHPKEFEANEDVRLYPNPNTGSACIEFTTAPEKGLITVLDILGKTMTQVYSIGHFQLRPSYRDFQDNQYQ